MVETLSDHPLGLRVAEKHGSAFHKREDGSYAMHMVAPDDPTCVFLEESLCSIHEQKPTTCRQYPFQFTRTPDGLYVGASFFCTSIRDNSGRPMAEHAVELLDLIPQAIISEVPETVSWSDYRELEQRFHGQDLDAACLQLAQEHGFEPLLEIAEFSALKLLLNLNSEADAAFASGQPLTIPSHDWQGGWSDLRAAQNREYDRELQAWARMYMHRKLLTLHRPLRHNLWSLILIPRVLRLTSALWPHRGQFWISLEQAEVLLGSRGRALDALATQFDRFLGHNEA